MRRYINYDYKIRTNVIFTYRIGWSDATVAEFVKRLVSTSFPGTYIYDARYYIISFYIFYRSITTGTLSRAMEKVCERDAEQTRGGGAFRGRTNG